MFEQTLDNNNAHTFPVRLYTVLSESMDDPSHELEDVVCFQPHGRAFKILDEETFRIRVLPQIFPGTVQVSWSDFVGQLTRYGFRRIASAGPDQGAYYHQFFLLGEPHLVQFITINRNRSVPREAGAEPNLGQLPALPGPRRQFAAPLFARSVSSLRGEHVLMCEPEVGASTLPPAQFDNGGRHVLMSLMAPGMSGILNQGPVLIQERRNHGPGIGIDGIYHIIDQVLNDVFDDDF